ncbi:MAG: DUF6463 family protein [Pseudomonadota bacterium]
MKNKIGIALVVIGLGHTTIGFLRFLDVFGAMFSEGLVSTGDGEVRGWAFWFIYTGVFMIALGITVRAIEMLGAAVPKLLGWVLLVSSVSGVVVFPVSGFWLIFAVSLLILLGGKQPPKDQVTRVAEREGNEV